MNSGPWRNSLLAGVCSALLGIGIIALFLAMGFGRSPSTYQPASGTLELWIIYAAIPFIIAAPIAGIWSGTIKGAAIAVLVILLIYLAIYLWYLWLIGTINGNNRLGPLPPMVQNHTS